MNINVGFAILADIDNKMTAAIYVENQIVAIIAGPSDIMYEKLKKVFL